MVVFKVFDSFIVLPYTQHNRRSAILNLHSTLHRGERIDGSDECRFILFFTKLKVYSANYSALSTLEGAECEDHIRCAVKTAAESGGLVTF